MRYYVDGLNSKFEMAGKKIREFEGKPIEVT